MKNKREAQQSNAAPMPSLTEAEVQQAAETRKVLGPPEIRAGEVTRISKLGTGSFGDVWKGTCREQPVAIKILHRQDFDAKQLQVFKREVEVLSQIYHPNVCLFMGACFEKGNMMIVSELLPRGDLEKMLRDKNLVMSLVLRVKMAIEAARGMCWLHYGDPAFVHRDVRSFHCLFCNSVTFSPHFSFLFQMNCFIGETGQFFSDGKSRGENHRFRTEPSDSSRVFLAGWKRRCPRNTVVDGARSARRKRILDIC